MSEHEDRLVERVAAPYTSGDLIRLATDRRGVQPLDPARALATYAHPDNWVSVNANDENGEMRHYWSWAGPMIVGYELAGYGLRAAIEAMQGAGIEALLEPWEPQVVRLYPTYSGEVGARGEIVGWSAEIGHHDGGLRIEIAGMADEELP